MKFGTDLWTVIQIVKHLNSCNFPFICSTKTELDQQKVEILLSKTNDAKEVYFFSKKEKKTIRERQRRDKGQRTQSYLGLISVWNPSEFSHPREVTGTCWNRSLVRLASNRQRNTGRRRMHIRRRFDVESRWAIRTYLRCNSTTQLIGYVDRGLDAFAASTPIPLGAIRRCLDPVWNRTQGLLYLIDRATRYRRRSIFFEQWITDNRRRCNLSYLGNLLEESTLFSILFCRPCVLVK